MAKARKPRRKWRGGKGQHCGICKHARWPRDKRSLGKCLVSEEHDHCAEVWPDGKMKIKSRWGSMCLQFEEKR